MIFFQLNKVNAFYDTKLEELEDRLKLLVDSVHSSEYFAKTRRSRSSSGDDMGHHRRLSVKEMIHRLQSINIQKPGKPEIELIDDELSDTEEKDAEQNVDEDRIRESDSVRRAIMDQYRMAKLLHNFSIMNYTGFVKIVKKHDKTFPDRKGEFKQYTKSSAVCKEGIGAESIADRMVREIKLFLATCCCSRAL